MRTEKKREKNKSGGSVQQTNWKDPTSAIACHFLSSGHDVINRTHF